MLNTSLPTPVDTPPERRPTNHYVLTLDEAIALQLLAGAHGGTRRLAKLLGISEGVVLRAITRQGLRAGSALVLRAAIAESRKARARAR